MSDLYPYRPRRQTSPNDIDLQDVTAQVIASRKRSADIEHLRTWSSALRHRLWRAHVRAELDAYAVDDIDHVMREIEDYYAAVGHGRHHRLRRTENVPAPSA